MQFCFSNGYCINKVFSDVVVKTTICTEKLAQVRIIPKPNLYIIEIVYEIEVPEMQSETKNIASIDLGLNNLVTITNSIGLMPIVINDKIIKSVNQYYNKNLAKLKSIAETSNAKKYKLGVISYAHKQYTRNDRTSKNCTCRT